MPELDTTSLGNKIALSASLSESIIKLAEKPPMNSHNSLQQNMADLTASRSELTLQIAEQIANQPGSLEAIQRINQLKKPKY